VPAVPPSIPPDSASPDRRPGLRVAIERPVRGGPPWTYVGTVERHSVVHRVEAVLASDGSVTVTLDGEEVASTATGLADRVRLLLRAVHRQATAEGLSAPARRIVRWRDGERVV
jgi:hypothetical protein